ncbi:hypothetical protein GCM10023204_33980 [Actinomycetospora succinea]
MLSEGHLRADRRARGAPRQDVERRRGPDRRALDPRATHRRASEADVEAMVATIRSATAPGGMIRSGAPCAPYHVVRGAPGAITGRRTRTAHHASPGVGTDIRGDVIHLVAATRCTTTPVISTATPVSTRQARSA